MTKHVFSRTAIGSLGRIAACLLLSIFTVGSMMGQSSAGFGGISGVVQDSSGAVVPNAKVVVENQSRGVRRELTTNASGNFAAPNLVPASGYKVTISVAGFAGYDFKEITVSVGETITLNPILNVSGSATQVDVTAEAPIIDDTKSDVSQVVNSKQILDLPINGRRVDSFVLLTPGVTTDGAFGLISFRGNPGGNTFLTDGNDTTNSFYDENAGRTRAYNISQDAVQEFQVVSSNFLAEYGHASGGVINTVTRSGSNDLHGTAYWFFRNRTLNATDITAHGVNPPEWRHQAGVSVGGPIVKNKVFYFFNGELTRRNAPIVSSNLSNTSGLFDANGNYIPTAAGKPNCTASASQCAAAVAYLQSRIDTQLVPRKVDTNLLFGKIDFHPNEKNTFSFSINYLDFRSPNGIQTQLSLADGSAIGNNADTNVFDRTGRISWTLVPTATSVNEVRFGWFKDRQYDPASPSLLPSIGPVALTVNGISNVGYANGYPRLNPSEQRFEIADTYSWILGGHSIKFGASYDHVEDYVSRLANRYGTYSYTTLTNFALDFTGNTAGAKNYSSYTQAFGNPVVDTNLNELSFFIQDQWRVNPKLTITPGIRYDYTGIPQPGLSNPAFPQTAHIPTRSGDWAPRLGVAYSLNPKTAIRAGFGLFYNRYTSSTIENFLITNGVYQSNYTFNTAATIVSAPVFPNALAAPPTNLTIAAPSIFAPSSSFRNPYSEQANVAVERQLDRQTSLSVSYVWSRGLHLLMTRDLNIAPTTTSQTFPILDSTNAQVGSYTTPLYTTRANPAYNAGIFSADSAANSYYNALLVNLSRRYSNWLQGSVAYTYGHAIDYNQGGGGNTLFGSTFATSVFNGDYRGEKGSSSIDQRHRLVINAIFAPTFTHGTDMFSKYVVNNWQLSAVEVAASSQPLAPSIRVQDRATGTISTSSLNGLGGSSRVPFESISALDIGPLYRTDARLAKMFPVTERLKVYLQFEAFNVFNHPIVSGSGPRVAQQYTAIKQTSGPLNGIIALVPNSAYGTILQTQISPDGTTARRAQASLRFVF